MITDVVCHYCTFRFMVLTKSEEEWEALFIQSGKLKIKH